MVLKEKVDYEENINYSNVEIDFYLIIQDLGDKDKKVITVKEIDSEDDNVIVKVHLKKNY